MRIVEDCQQSVIDGHAVTCDGGSLGLDTGHWVLVSFRLAWMGAGEASCEVSLNVQGRLEGTATLRPQPLELTKGTAKNFGPLHPITLK